MGARGHEGGGAGGGWRGRPIGCGEGSLLLSPLGGPQRRRALGQHATVIVDDPCRPPLPQENDVVIVLAAAKRAPGRPYGGTPPHTRWSCPSPPLRPRHPRGAAVLPHREDLLPASARERCPALPHASRPLCRPARH